MQEMKTLTIGGITFRVVDDESVHHTQQNLSEEQQMQARENIGSASSWHDLTDKPFYSASGGFTEIFSAELTMHLMTNHTDTYQMMLSPAPFVLTEFETYVVELDGSRHVLECATGNDSRPTLKHIVLDEDGNWQAGSFIIEYDSEVAGLEGGMVNLIVVGNEADHTLTIHHEEQIIKPLAAKFLPWDVIDARVKRLTDEALGADEQPTSIDLSSFESEGKIVETFADGSTSTTVMEFDADGRPTKITDGNGNVTVLTW